MDGTETLLLFAVMLSLYASAWAAGLAQGLKRNGGAAGTAEKPSRPSRERKAGRKRDTQEQAGSPQAKPLAAALDNLAAYGTGQQQTEVEDRHEAWEG